MPTTIEWSNETWNPTVGCMKVSAGCEHCYAMTLAHRLPAMGQTAYEGLTRKLPDGSVNWTGKVRMLPERLNLPLKWRKPRMIIVDSMSDLFHEDVPDEFIDQAFAVMALTPWHTYQILTKRPARLMAYMTKLVQGPWAGRMFRDGQPDTDVHRRVRDAMVETFRTCSADVLNRASDWQEEHYPAGDGFMRDWPLPNVWLGTSVEDQRAADERIPLLLQTPAAVRFLSCEPLLGPIGLRDILVFDEWLNEKVCIDALGGEWVPEHRAPVTGTISWVIAGGESGPGYRPMDLAWIRSLRDQCKTAGVAFFAKQNSGPRTHMPLPDDLQSHEFPEPAREAVHA